MILPKSFKWMKTQKFPPDTQDQIRSKYMAKLIQKFCLIFLNRELRLTLIPFLRTLKKKNKCSCQKQFRQNFWFVMVMCSRIGSRLRQKTNIFLAQSNC